MTTLLCDSDIFAFKCAALNTVKSPFGTWSYSKQAMKALDDYIAQLMDKLKGDTAVMCLTDPEYNFRYEVMENYKERDRSERPPLLQDLKDYLADEYTSYIRPGLEADDIMGILQTHPSLIEDKDRIIVSEDKDLRTVPGRLYAPHRRELGVVDISSVDAARFHMWQTVVGDPVDGFGGAYKVGKESEYAISLLECEMHELWDTVLDAYASVGKGEHEALVNARMAKILTWEHYDFKKKEVIHWTPLNLLTNGKVIEQ